MRRDSFLSYLDSRQKFHPRFVKIYSNFLKLRGGGYGSLTENPIQELKEFYNDIKFEQGKLPQAKTDLASEEAALACPLAWSRFFREGQCALEIYYAIPWKQLATETLEDGSRRAGLYWARSVRDTASRILSHDLKKGYIRVPAGVPVESQVYINQITEILEPGTYRVSLEIGHPAGHRVFEKTLEVTVPECSSARLLISDLEPSFGVSPLGEQSRSNPFAKGNLVVNPYPFEQFSVSRPSTFYFEV
jgi:hypothetical protein